MAREELKGEEGVRLLKAGGMEVEAHGDWRDFSDSACFHVNCEHQAGKWVDVMRDSEGQWFLADEDMLMMDVAELTAVMLLREGPWAVVRYCDRQREKGKRRG